MAQTLFLELLLLSVFLTATHGEDLTRYVDPRIGTEGQGNVIIGPSMPFGMIKPGPEYSKVSNTGYSPDPAKPLLGFGQVHVSGTGGGAKYGNISVLPFTGETSSLQLESLRQEETTALGYYSVLLQNWNIQTELTASHKVAFYRFGFRGTERASVKIDAASFLNESTQYPEKEGQYFVGSEIEIVSDHEVRGYNRVRGGWNHGRAYAVYFHAVFDQPFAESKTWANDQISNAREQVRGQDKTGALLSFAGKGSRSIQMKLGISFISSAKAWANVKAEIPDWNFNAALAKIRLRWQTELERIEVSPSATDAQKRMFYTAIYHGLLMPADRTDENPLWNSPSPSYDDFYALWDTYRTQLPLITLLNPQRETDIVNSLLDIYRYDGFLPDARSGNSNGRTQGGSNADVVIADAYVKKLAGVDWKLALEAMLKNADVAPGGTEEQEGRGGLPDYNKLGYVSTNYPRAGTRTIEYSYDDFCIATVAKGLGEEALFNRFSQQANNWKKLWRADFSDHGSTGFIMPRDANGKWEESVKITVDKYKNDTIPYVPTYTNLGKYEDWWSGFIYEGKSWEYSLSIPHDIAGLIEKCGGAEAFKTRLDTLFAERFYYVGNEPSFLSPTLYHWIGKPELSSQRIHEIVNRAFNDSPKGLPGNDDSGAMSIWLAFHMMGIYPNAGQSYYLINTPLLAESTLHLAGGKTFRIVTKNFTPENPFIVSAKLNGQPLSRAWIEHAEIISGGVLELELGAQPTSWGSTELPPSRRF